MRGSELPAPSLETGTHALIVSKYASLSLLVELLRTKRTRVSGAHSWSEMEDTLCRIKMDLVIIPLDLLQANVSAIKHSHLARTKSPVALIEDRDARYSEAADRNLCVVGRLPYRADPAAMAADISALLERIRFKDLQKRAGSLQFGNLQLDPLSRSFAGSKGDVVYLDDDEFELLQLLCEHSGSVLSQAQIVRTLYHTDSRSLRRRLIRVAASLQAKVEQSADIPEVITEVGDFGFVLLSPESDGSSRRAPRTQAPP